MNCVAAIEQRENALAGVFFMLVALTLVNIRALLDIRARHAFLSPAAMPPNSADPVRAGRRALERSLRACELAAHQLIAVMRCRTFELMKLLSLFRSALDEFCANDRPWTSCANAFDTS